MNIQYTKKQRLERLEELNKRYSEILDEEEQISKQRTRLRNEKRLISRKVKHHLRMICEGKNKDD